MNQIEPGEVVKVIMAKVNRQYVGSRIDGTMIEACPTRFYESPRFLFTIGLPFVLAGIIRTIVEILFREAVKLVRLTYWTVRVLFIKK